MCAAVSVCVPAGAQVTENTAQATGGTAQKTAHEPRPNENGPSKDEPSKHDKQQAESAYYSGAKKLERDELDAAEQDFLRASKLDPENRNYAVAISVTRQHRVMELVRQSTKARESGEIAKADTLLAQARTMDPQNPLVLEHGASDTPQPDTATVASVADTSTGILDDDLQPWKIRPPVLAGPVELRPSSGTQDFDLRGASADVLQQVAHAYGIRTVMDDSLQRKQVRFYMQNVSYEQAMNALLGITHAFAVPVDQTTVVVANDDGGNRARLGRQLEETIDVPGATQDQLNELINVIRQIFDVRQAVVQTSGGRIVVRAPEEVFGPLNATLDGLMENGGEVTIEVKLFEITTTKTRNIGAALPSQFTVFNVDQAATQIVNQNQSLVQQAIAQGYISANASNLQIALALIGAGLVQSNLANNLIGVFGGGTLQTGIAASSATTFNFALNSSETRALDDVLLRVGDRKDATFREGTRYPIVTSTYTTGISTAPSSVSNASINGVNVANLLSQFAGGTSATIPQVTYEDLGLTLNAHPVIQRDGRVQMHLEMKIEALSGQSLDGNPVLLSRQLKSDLSLGEGESALMASSVSKTETAALTGLPGLSELPGFQTPTQKQTERDTEQLVIVVTPHVVRKRTVDVAGPRMVVHTGTANP